MSMLVSTPSFKPVSNGASANMRQGRQVGYAAPFAQNASAGASAPKFGFYIPLVCEIIAGVGCLLPMLGVALLALLGRKKA